MTAKSIVSHLLACLVGVCLGVLLVTKGCPPVPVPAAAPHVDPPPIGEPAHAPALAPVDPGPAKVPASETR